MRKVLVLAGVGVVFAFLTGFVGADAVAVAEDAIRFIPGCHAFSGDCAGSGYDFSLRASVALLALTGAACFIGRALEVLRGATNFSRR